MRRLLPSFQPLALGLLVAGVAGCGDPNAGRLFFDLQYAVRCDTTLHCGPTEMRDICGIAAGEPCNMGAEQVSASCSVSETESNRTLSFSATQPAGEEDFSIRITGATFTTAGGSASGDCVVTVQDGPNVYEGACGSSAPSSAQPCQINAVMFYADPEDGVPVVEGSLFCQGLPGRSNPLVQIEVTAFGDGPTAASTPATFRIRNCSGLTL